MDIDPDEDRDKVLSSCPPRPCHTPTPVENSPPSSTPYPPLSTNSQSLITSITEIPLTGDPVSINIPSSIESHQPPSDPGVAFVGCTAESSPVQSTRGVLQSPITSVPVLPLTDDSHSINIPSSIESHRPPSDPGVAFVGCTAESCSVQSSHGILNGSSIVNDNPSNDTDNLATNPNNLSNVEPPVALSGCTVGDRDDFNTADSNTQSHNTRGKELEFVPQWYD